MVGPDALFASAQRGPERWVHVNLIQISWLVRAAWLPLTLLLVVLFQQSGSYPVVLAGLLAATSVFWIAWLWVRPWRSPIPGGGVVATLLLMAIAATSGAATMIDGPGWSANFTAIVVLEAGATVRTRPTAGVMLMAGVGLGLGTWVHGGNADGLWGQLPAAFYFVFYVILFGFVALAGVLRGLRREQLVQAERLASQRQEASKQREQAAALAERARIAREIHDILAHSLAALSIQLEVADALLSEQKDTVRALDHVRQAHRLADEGMEETRRAIDALRSDTPPLPDALAAMVGGYRREGGTVSMYVEGSPRPLSVSAGLAMLRIAQEALSNANKYAAGKPVELRLRYGQDRVTLIVTDNSIEMAAADAEVTAQSPGIAGVSGGYGLAGMHERLRLLGGSLSAGPVSGGWAVHAEVPG